MKFLLANARILDPTSKHHGKVKDILIEDDLIKEIGTDLSAKSKVDASGCICTPGFVDMMAHFHDPGNEHKEDLESGSSAAAMSGFTDVALIPNTDPVISSKADVAYLLNKQFRSQPEIHVIAAVSEGCEGENLTEILDMHAAGAKAFSDGINPIWNPELLLKALQYVQRFGGLVINRPKDINLSQHAHMHEGAISTSLGLKGEPAISEIIAIARDIEILKYTGGRLHFSQVSTAGGLELIKKGKKEGLSLTCDVAIHQLLYTDEALVSYDTNLKADPPFRSAKDRKALIKGIKDGTVDAIVSAHQPQDSENKELEFDLAMPGVCSLPTFYSQLNKLSEEIEMEVLIQKVATNPRKILGLTKVSVEEGSSAKMSVFDSTSTWIFNDESNPSKSQNSPEWGKEQVGKCTGIYSRGWHANHY